MYSVDNATFTFPSSPLLTQNDDVSEDMLCSGNGEGRCRHPVSGALASCECVHVRRIPLGSTVEVVLLDQGEILYFRI